ncbi:MAG: folate-binding protein YgfZ [Acidimicrobiia bacterium]|nr:folate-binding protein YgfZ [Acidimicrobiia bacterium]
MDSYGDVTGEYQALHRSAGVVDGAHVLVRVAGPDAETFLDSLLSQDLGGLADGTVVRSLLLGPRGKLRALLWVVRFGDEFLLVSDAATGPSVVEDLARFKLRVQLEIGEPEPVLDLIGPDSAAVVDGLDEGTVERAIPAPLGGLGRYFLVGASADDLATDVRPVGRLASTAVRVEMGEPAMGRDVDESTIPQEAGDVAESVSFTKGCYLGQELVARIDSRGHVNRHLRGLVLTENALPPDGAEIVVDDAPVGTITSVSESLTVGAPIGLGLIRREVEPGSPVEIRWNGGSARADVRSLPLL